MTLANKDKAVGDLVWVPAGVRLWQLLDEDKKIPKYKIKVFDEPKYLLITGFSKHNNCQVSFDGEEWYIDMKMEV
tara:strand:- start:3241 stop:3465 length:225 start_codon:yes stop_codon:yes gene_type:complete